MSEKQRATIKSVFPPNIKLFVQYKSVFPPNIKSFVQYKSVNKLQANSVSGLSIFFKCISISLFTGGLFFFLIEHFHLNILYRTI